METNELVLSAFFWAGASAGAEAIGTEDPLAFAEKRLADLLELVRSGNLPDAEESS